MASESQKEMHVTKLEWYLHANTMVSLRQHCGIFMPTLGSQMAIIEVIGGGEETPLRAISLC